MFFYLYIYSLDSQENVEDVALKKTFKQLPRPVFGDANFLYEELISKTPYIHFGYFWEKHEKLLQDSGLLNVILFYFLKIVYCILNKISVFAEICCSPIIFYFNFCKLEFVDIRGFEKNLRKLYIQQNLLSIIYCYTIKINNKTTHE